MIGASTSDDAGTNDPYDFEEEDQDPTMVAKTRGDASPPRAPPMLPQVSPAAARSNVPTPTPSQPFKQQPLQRQTPPPPPQQHQRPLPSRFGQTAALGRQAPPMLVATPYPQMPPQKQYMHPPHAEFPFNETLGLPQGPVGPPHDPNDDGRPLSNAPHDFVPRSGPHPTGQSGEFIARPSPRIALTMDRRGAPTDDNRTVTAERLKRRPPSWVVAALSCSIALLIAGFLLAPLSSTNALAPTRATKSPTTTSGSSASAVTAVAAGATGTSPFTTAHAAFDNVVSQPGSPLAPFPSPGLPPAAVTDPPPRPTAAVTEPVPATVDPPPTMAVAAAAPAPPPIAVPVAAAPIARPTQGPVAPSAAAPIPAAKPPKPAALGAITIVCMPKCDQITDNGTALGPGHIFNRPVPSGRHVLQLSAPNGAHKNLVVEVAPEQTKEVRMSMDK
jgi:hypothetical protein